MGFQLYIIEKPYNISDYNHNHGRSDRSIGIGIVNGNIIVFGIDYGDISYRNFTLFRKR